MEKIIIKDSEIQDVKNEIVAIAMLNFGVEKYRIQEGYSEWTLLDLSQEIANKLEKTGFCEKAIIESDFLVECVQGMVSDYIKRGK